MTHAPPSQAAVGAWFIWYDMHRRSIGRLSLVALILAAPPALSAQERRNLTQYDVRAAPTVLLSDDGTPERDFRDAIVRRMSSGRLVVAQPDLGVIRVFERDGSASRVLARQGNGPGEMPGPFSLAAFRDTVLAFGRPPLSPAAVYVFDEAVGYRSQLLTETLGVGSVVVVDRLATGAYLVKRGSAIRRVLRAEPRSGTLIADSATYGVLSVWDGTNAKLQWLATVVQQWSFAHPWPRGPMRSTLSPYPFAPMTFVVASSDRIWVVAAADGTLRALSPSGAIVASTTLSGSARAFDFRVLAARRTAALAAARRSLDSARASAMFDRSLLPRTMPWVSAVVAGPDGEVWLRRFDPDHRAPQRFIVVDRNGQEAAEAEVPGEIELQQVGRDFVVGVRTAADGRMSIVELAIRRGGRQGEWHHQHRSLP